MREKEREDIKNETSVGREKHRKRGMVEERRIGREREKERTTEREEERQG